MSTEEAVCLPEIKATATQSLAFIDEQAREFSATVFVGVKSLLQRSYEEAEEQLAAYQAAANEEIAQTETLLATLQERNIQLLQDNQTLQDTLAQAKEVEYELQKSIQSIAQEKRDIQDEKRSVDQTCEKLHADIETLQVTIERLNSYNQTIQAEQSAQISELHQQHIDKINELQDFFEASMQSAQATHHQELDKRMRIHQEERESRETHFQQLIEKLTHEKTKVIDENIILQKEIGEQRIINAQVIQKMEDEFHAELQRLTARSSKTIETLEKTNQEYRIKIEHLEHALSQANLAQQRDRESISQQFNIKIERLEHLLNQERQTHEREKDSLLKQAQIKIEQFEHLLSQERNVHALEIENVKRQAHISVEKIEHLLLLEKEDKKNIQAKAHQHIENQCQTFSENTKKSAMHYIQKEKAELIKQHELAMHSLKKSFELTREKDRALIEKLHAKCQEIPSASSREIQLERDLSIMAQKKYTIELHFKKLQKEVIALKQIISELRKKH